MSDTEVPSERRSEKLPRPSVPEADDLLGEPISCLDHGFVRLIDYMGDDAAIVQAARVSYGKGTKKVHQDRGLIRYLMRHHHTTPFEMVEFKFHARMPIFVARQWVRHRTANINEYSLRYSSALDDFYVPDRHAVRFQSTLNRQGGSDESVPEELTERVIEMMREDARRSYAGYKELEDAGIARELARSGLSVGNYTEWYWKVDLHNLFHFLQLRMDDHAQYEIRVFARAMADIVKNVVPLAWEAFEDYRQGAIRLTRLEVETLSRLLREPDLDPIEALPEVWRKRDDDGQLKRHRERDEWLAKLARLRGDAD